MKTDPDLLAEAAGVMGWDPATRRTRLGHGPGGNWNPLEDLNAAVELADTIGASTEQRWLLRRKLSGEHEAFFDDGDSCFGPPAKALALAALSALAAHRSRKEPA